MKNPDETICISLLCREGITSRIVYQVLVDAGFQVQVIIENKESNVHYLKRRARKLGWFVTFGQVGYLLLAKFQRKLFRRQNTRIAAKLGLSVKPIPDSMSTRVESVNSPDAIELLNRQRPDAVVVNGTRILSKKLISTVTAPIINTHLGITPKYRGVYGGYWARVMNDPENVGATVHLIDPGIDTGEILKQSRVAPKDFTNSCVLPTIQLAAVVREMPVVIRELVNGTASPQPASGQSRLWHHPTLWQYLRYGFSKGVW